MGVEQGEQYYQRLFTEEVPDNEGEKDPPSAEPPSLTANLGQLPEVAGFPAIFGGSGRDEREGEPAIRARIKFIIQWFLGYGNEQKHSEEEIVTARAFRKEARELKEQYPTLYHEVRTTIHEAFWKESAEQYKELRASAGQKRRLQTEE